MHFTWCGDDTAAPQRQPHANNNNNSSSDRKLFEMLQKKNQSCNNEAKENCLRFAGCTEIVANVLRCHRTTERMSNESDAQIRQHSYAPINTEQLNTESKRIERTNEKLSMAFPLLPVHVCMHVCTWVRVWVHVSKLFWMWHFFVDIWSYTFVYVYLRMTGLSIYKIFQLQVLQQS